MVIVQGQAGLPDGAKISIEGAEEEEDKAAPDEKKGDAKESQKK
jgi:hypothetical protein